MLTIAHEVALGPRTTLGIGGAARHWAGLADADAVPEAIAWARERGLAWTVVGGGSNLLVADEGYPGLAIHLENREIEATGARRARVGAGGDWDTFVAWCCERGWAGVERLSGIPGTVGATPIQNVGAYGQEVAEVVVRVRAWDAVAEAWVELRAEGCGFAYRTSRFNRQDAGRFVITEVEFQLRAGDVGARAEVLATRRAKGMVIDPGDPESRSAGSFFKNPWLPADQVAAIARAAGAAPPQFPAGGGRVKVPAAWLIEHAGFAKGFQLPGSRVGLSRKHVLAIVNRGGGTCAEVLRLAEHIRAAVAARFGVELAREPVQI